MDIENIELLTTQPLDNDKTIESAREELVLLIAKGNAKELLGKTLSQNEIKNLSSDDVLKYQKRYQAVLASKITDSMTQSIITGITKAVGMAVPIKDMSKYQDELKQDYIINQELKNLSGTIYQTFGRLSALISFANITIKNTSMGQLLNKEEELPVSEDIMEVVNIITKE